MEKQRGTDLDYKRDFFRKHGGMESCSTSGMTEYGTYVKTYTTTDGKGVLTEVNGPAFLAETWTNETTGEQRTEMVKYWCTEIWHTDDANSKKWYSHM